MRGKTRHKNSKPDDAKGVVVAVETKIDLCVDIMFVDNKQHFPTRLLVAGALIVENKVKQVMNLARAYLAALLFALTRKLLD